VIELITVDVDYSYDGDQRFYAVSLMTHTWLCLIHIAPEDVPRLSDVTSTPWDSGALRIGDSAGVGVFWSVNGEDDKDTVVILVGDDDETWDISFAVPATTIDEILDAIKAVDAP
jgi:hypothetical protein